MPLFHTTKIVELASVRASFAFILPVVEKLHGEGVEILWVCGKGKLGRQMQLPGRVVEIGPDRELSPLQDVMFVFRLAWILFRDRVDLLHTHTPKAGLLGGLGGKLAGCPVVVHHLHGFLSDTNDWRLRMIAGWSERIAFGLSTDAVPVARWMFSRLKDTYVGSNTKVVLIGEGSACGIDVVRQFNPAFYRERRATFREEKMIPVDAFVVGFVGRFGAEKGSRSLSEFWKRFNSLNRKAYLLLVGSVEERYRTDLVLYETLKNCGNVRVIDWTDDVPSCYAAMDVLIHPSYREGLPYSVLEASSMEVPVVATDIPGCAEVLEGALAFGRLVAIDDVDAMIRCVQEYLANVPMRQREGILARSSVVRRYSREEVASGICEYLTDVVKRDNNKII